MKSTFIAACWLGSFAFAMPVIEDKRYLVTEVVLETATVTVTGTRGWGDWSWGRKPSPTVSNTISIVDTSLSTILTSSTVVSTTFTSSVTSSGIPLTTSTTPSPDTTTISNSQPASTSSVGSVSPYADPILHQHNLHRSNHSAPPLEWDDNLASIAQEIASSCRYAHNVEAGGGGYGQNIGAGVQDDKVDTMITNQMYNDEMMFYPGYGSEPSMDNFESWGHFSQIVWKASAKVGCFTQHCPDGLSGVASDVAPYFTVCNYQPAGRDTKGLQLSNLLTNVAFR